MITLNQLQNQGYAQDSNKVDSICFTFVLHTGYSRKQFYEFLYKQDPNNPQLKDIGLYARLIIPLDAPKERINCNTLYQLELQRRRLEVERLRQEIEYLKLLQNNGEFEN